MTTAIFAGPQKKASIVYGTKTAHVFTQQPAFNVNDTVPMYIVSEYRSGLDIKNLPTHIRVLEVAQVLITNITKTKILDITDEHLEKTDLDLHTHIFNTGLSTDDNSDCFVIEYKLVSPFKPV